LPSRRSSDLPRPEAGRASLNPSLTAVGGFGLRRRFAQARPRARTRSADLVDSARLELLDRSGQQLLAQLALLLTGIELAHLQLEVRLRPGVHIDVARLGVREPGRHLQVARERA